MFEAICTVICVICALVCTVRVLFLDWSKNRREKQRIRMMLRESYAKARRDVYNAFSFPGFDVHTGRIDKNKKYTAKDYLKKFKTGEKC